MKIAFYKANRGTLADKLIGFVTKSKYSHCELVFSDGEFASSSIRDGGIRFKYIIPDDKWDIFDITIKRNEYFIHKWFELCDDDKYDWVGAFGSAIGFDLTNRNRKFCSYACAKALDLNPITTPQGLLDQLKKLYLIRE